jgi:hypothetical protein
VRWLVDECVDAGVGSSLRSWGHDIVDIAEGAPSINDNGVVD